METQSALVRADGAVKLYAVADVDLYLTLVVNPGHAESRDALGLDKALDNLCLLELGMLVIYIFNGDEHFSYCLQILCFAWMLVLQLLHNCLYVHSLLHLKVIVISS